MNRSGRKMASEELVEVLLGRAFKALQIWPHFSCPITAASIPPARTPSSNQGSLHAIPGAADSFFLGAFAHAVPHPLARAALPTFYSQSAQALRHRSSCGLSGSLAAKAPPVSQRNTCNTTWRHKPQPRTLPLRPATPTPARDCPHARPLLIHAQRAVLAGSETTPHKSVLLEE